MKTFLKVVLLLIVAVIAVKLLPLIFGLGWLLAGALLGIIVLGFSAMATLLGSAIVIAALLSPVWVPVLVILAMIALFKRGTRRSGGVAA